MIRAAAAGLAAACLLALPALARPEASRIPRRPPPPPCVMPALLPDLPLAVIEHHDASTLSTAFLGDPEEVVEVADVELLPGPPLQLLIAADRRTIYRFSGKVGRLRRLILAAPVPTGATGVPRGRIAFARHCRPAAHRHEDEWEVRRFGGRSAALIGGRYELWRVRIGARIEADPVPSVDVRSTPEINELYSFSRGGLTRIDPRSVVADVAVGAYPVWPQEAGVAQLVASGALIRATKADSERWQARAAARGIVGPRAVYGLAYGIYRVTRPIRLPPGLCGSHLIRLYAPSPAWVRGDPCHSTLYFDDGTSVGT